MKTRFEGYQPIGHDRKIWGQEYQHDAYKAKGKLQEPTFCPKCGVVYHEGRWQWAVRPQHAHEELCPACHRTHDEFPAGFVTIGGPFFNAHRDELFHQIKNVEAKAKAEHPMERIMQFEVKGSGMLITTTGTHLARKIGEALHHAYDGELEFHYNEDDNLLRVVWER